MQMRKTRKAGMCKMAAAATAAAVAATMCAAVPAMAAGVSTGSTASEPADAEDISPSPSTVDSVLYTETDGVADGVADTVKGTWSVTIPDSVALQKEGNDKAPGVYAGTGTVRYSGEIGTAQNLTVSPSAVTMTDSKKWSKPVTITPMASGLTGLDYSAVKAGGSGEVAFSSYFAPGNWTGTCTYTIALGGGVQ